MTKRRWITLKCGHVVPANDLRPDRCVHEWHAHNAQLRLWL